MLRLSFFIGFYNRFGHGGEYVGGGNLTARLYLDYI